MGTQAIVLAMLVGIIGMPHGGLDHRVGRVLLRPAYGIYWLPLFLAGYLSVMAVVMAGWLWVPLMTLAGFILLSAVHFGTADEQPEKLGVPALTILDGGMVVWVTALVHPHEMTQLLSWIVPGDRWPTRLLFDPAVRAGLSMAIAVVIGRAIVSAPGTAIRILGFTTLFAVAPPLVGFMLYFCGWHSIVELVRLARQANPNHLATGLGQVVMAAAPLSVSAVMLVVAGWAVASDGGPLTPGIIQAVFVGLSVVAVPHMLLHWVAARQNVNPFAVVDPW